MTDELQDKLNEIMFILDRDEVISAIENLDAQELVALRTECREWANKLSAMRDLGEERIGIGHN
jgi:hypothetical protein